MRGLICGVMSLIGMAAAATPTYTTPYKAEECRVREGVGRVLAKMRTGKPVKIAYLGGSITEIDGWRRLSCEWLRQRYPTCSISEIAAAIGGTGSSLGVFRVGEDVLAHDPDLLFVEFATNDSGEAPETIWRNMEGIVRQTWRHNPDTDIVFTYTITEAMLGDYKAGRCPRAASCMEMLADHYGIPSICFGPRVAADVAAGKLVMTIGEVETAVPPETPNRDQAIAEELAKKGQVLFSKDGVHPVLDGAAYYLESIKAAWLQFEAHEGVADHLAKLETVFFDTSYEKAKLVFIDRGFLRGTWRKIGKDDQNAGFAGRFGCLPWFSNTPGSRLKFRFWGTKCMLYDLLGPDCGQYWITIDGVRQKSPMPLFDSYCTYYRLASQPVFEGADGIHTIELELDSNQPDRSSVSIHLSNPTEELKDPRYNGTTWYLGRLMLVGDIEVPESEGNWFDAHVGQYEEWPVDAVLSEGGEWADSGKDCASLWKKGSLEVEAMGKPLIFGSSDARILGGNARTATVETDVGLDEFEFDKLPEIDSDWKGGVVVSRINDESCYMGIARVGTKNAWVRLNGAVAPCDQRTVRLNMMFGIVGNDPYVRYVVDGVVCSFNEATNIPIAVSSWPVNVSQVLFGGQGDVSRLVASYEEARHGLVLIVK